MTNKNQLVEKASSELVRGVFNSTLTVEGLKKLRKQYPKNMKVNMSDEQEFKDARKSKAEMNKKTKSIKETRISHCKDVKTVGDALEDEVKNIYSVVVTPFEIEDKRRKEKAQRLENEKQALLQEQRNDINNIKNFVTTAIGKDSDFIQGAIEAVDLIEPEVFHQELIHEVIEVKKETLTALTINLNDAISREKLEEERVKLDEERKKMEAEQAKKDKAAKIQERINNLKMIPVNYLDKTSKEIQEKIEALSDYTVDENVFGDRVIEVEQNISSVVTQLTQMAKMKKFEESQAKEAEEKEIAESLEFDSSIEFKEPEPANPPKDEPRIESEPREEVEEKHGQVVSGCDAVTEGLKSEAVNAQILAEKKWHAYASHLPLGEERVRAFEVYERIRLSVLVK